MDSGRWMVLDSEGERVVEWCPSFLGALRQAKRRSGGRVELRRVGTFGLLVVGRLHTYLIVGTITEHITRRRRVAFPVGEGLLVSGGR